MARYRLTEGSQRNPQQKTTASYRAGWDRVWGEEDKTVYCKNCKDELENIQGTIMSYHQLCYNCYLTLPQNADD